MLEINIILDKNKHNYDEVRRMFIHTIEQINQYGIQLDQNHKGKLEYLARQYNQGKMTVDELRNSLNYVFREALNIFMATKNIEQKKYIRKHAYVI